MNLRENLEAVCASCERREYTPSLWFGHVWFLYRLKQAGYPFGREDLSLDEWLAIGELRSADR